MAAVRPLITPKTIAASADSTGAAAIFFKKYREIIIAVALFLLFDLGVLLLNFATSYQIGEDAIGINLAGRQRMLSQRMAKALLAVDAARTHNAPQAAELAELDAAVQLFDHTLKGFQHGLVVPGGSGQPVLLHAAQGPQARQVLQQAQALWSPYLQILTPVLTGNASTAQLDAAVRYAQTHNQALLGLMNQLTSALEGTASARAHTLRQVQTGGIVLALLNFVFILFKVLRRLHAADAAAHAATAENRKILASVREGLFLITPDFQLASQISLSAHQLLGCTLRPGDDFFALLSTLVQGKLLQDAQDYVELLFAPHVQESLAQDLNPLSEIKATVPNRYGQPALRTLAFRFNRVSAGPTVLHLLVTVQDVSERSLLQEQLHTERQRAHKELDLLLTACHTDPTLLSQFAARAHTGLLDINSLLSTAAQGPAALRQAMEQSVRRIHAIKGDAGALGLDMYAQLAHNLESALLQVQSDSSGDCLLALPLPLEELLLKTAAFQRLAQVQRKTPATSTDPASGQALEKSLARLVHDIAHAQGKNAIPEIEMACHGGLGSETADIVREMASQLVHNAVVHGIEPPDIRLAMGKAAAGRIEVQLHRSPLEWILHVRDDGRGMHAEAIRRKLLEMGWYTQPQLDSFGDRQVLEHIFKPGFSTAEATTVLAGRGLGLDVVQAHVRRLGGHLTLLSTPGQFTEFTIRFEA
jgi:two-component system chemotaxis sensor kinase CheA